MKNIAVGVLIGSFNLEKKIGPFS